MAEAKQNSGNKAINIMLWLLVCAAIVAGVWANYHYQMIDLSLRIIGWVVLVVICLGIALLTSQGKKAFSFAKASRGELRKVVWPTRPETVRMTMIVIALVIVLSLIIWGLDSFLLWAIGLLTGQRG
jgi:preprotein translocase subunit SecE